MRHVLLGILLLSSLAFPAMADAGQTRVRPYTKRNGTSVQPYMRTTPNSSRMDNWSTRGNSNPYTGKRGTKSPYRY